MEHIEVINAIIEAEHHAQQIAQEAMEQRNELPQQLKEESERLRAKYFAQADKRIEEVDRQETAAADERIAQVERKRQASLESIEQIYSENKDRWIDELFHAIID